MLRFSTALVVIAVALAACGDDATTTTMDDHHHDDETTFAFGEPGHAEDADRVIELVTNDVLRFEPDSFEVALGDTVTFRVTNDGLAAHDFTLGDQATQEEHGAMMAEMTDMSTHDEPNAIVVQVGETKELTWTFTVAGEVLIGCHQPGHYEAGMLATITVTG
jgi:uncharacterized cupredoxin-like copper-binding protein